MSVSWQDLTEVADWVASSWPQSPWTNDSVNTIRDRLEVVVPGALPEDLWGAVYAVFSEGVDFPPNPSKFVAEVGHQARKRITDNPPPALPADTVIGREALDKYLAGAGFKTFREAVEHYAAKAQKERAT